MKLILQLFGGRGLGSGGSYRMVGHKLPEEYKPNSSMTRYNKNGQKRETRYYDEKGNKKKDVHYMGPPGHNYPHNHYWYKDENGNWHRTPYKGE